MSTSQDRRAFLRGLAVVPLLGGSAAAATPLPASPESELLRIGKQLDAAMVEFEAAQARVQEAHAEFERRRPPVPDEAIRTEADRLWSVSHTSPVDIEGKSLPFDRRPLLIIPSWAVIGRLECMDGRLRAARLLRARLPAILAYEETLEKLRDDLGAGDLIEARYWAARKAEKLARAIMEAEATSIQELAIKARALLSHTRSEHTPSTWLNTIHAKSFAENVIAVAG